MIAKHEPSTFRRNMKFESYNGQLDKHTKPKKKKGIRDNNT